MTATEGARVGLVAELLGTPFLPWQQYTADVAGELNPDGTYRYKVVVVTVPRQSGKTTLLRAVGVDRCVSRPGLGVFYTAQTGKDARERWQDLVKAINSSALSPLSVIRQAAGNERVVFANGSMFRCFAPVATSLHGYTPPLVMLDEAFAHDQQTGDDLMGAIGPAQITIPHKQLWIVSTKGTALSTFLESWIESGRAGTEGVALLEWAAGPEVTDVYDPETWPTFHPAMVPMADGRQLVPTEAIAEQAESLSRAEFERAYANRPTRTSSHLIPAELWDSLTNDEQRPPSGSPSDVAFVFDVMDDRSNSSVVATWRDGGKLQGRVVKTAPGMDWLPETMTRLRAVGWRQFACTDDGPAREVADALEREQFLPVQRLNGREFADSWGTLMQAMAVRELQHDGSEAFATAAANVATRTRGDTAAPSRRHSAGDITALVGLMVGAWVLDHPAYTSGTVEIRFTDDS